MIPVHNINLSHKRVKNIPYPFSRLEKTRTEIGEMCEIGVYHLGYDFPLWFGMFANSKIAEMFCLGDPSIVGGITGRTLARMVEQYYLWESRASLSSDISFPSLLSSDNAQLDRQYFDFGSHMTYLQWHLNIPFREIISWVPVSIALQISVEATEAGNLSNKIFIQRMCQQMNQNRITCPCANNKVT